MTSVCMSAEAEVQAPKGCMHTSKARAVCLPAKHSLSLLVQQYSSLDGQRLCLLPDKLCLGGHELVISKGAVVRQVHQTHLGDAAQIGLHSMVDQVFDLAHQLFQAGKGLQVQQGCKAVAVMLR